MLFLVFGESLSVRSARKSFIAIIVIDVKLKIFNIRFPCLSYLTNECYENISR